MEAWWGWLLAALLLLGVLKWLWKTLKLVLLLGLVLLAGFFFSRNTGMTGLF